MNKREIKVRQTLLVEKFLGKNNRDEAYELPLGQLSAASNVDITLQQRIRSRVGQTLITAGSYKSLHGFGDHGYIVKAGYLTYIDAGLNETSIKFIGTNECSMVEHNDVMFYSNSSLIGYVKDKVAYGFATPVDQYRSNPPSGQILAILGGRLYIAIGPYIYFTDIGKFHSVDMRQNARMLPKRITMMQPVDDGMYISSAYKTYFAAGVNPYKQPLREVFPYPALEGQQVEVSARMVGEGMEGKCVAWMTNHGQCYGFNGGKAINVTEPVYEVPGAVRASSLYKNKDNLSQVITVLN